MNARTSNQKLILTGAGAIACILHTIGLIRYLGRMPDDWVGIGLYIAAIIAFAILALGSYVQWAKEKQKE